MTDTKPPLPPFTIETAKQKVRMAENAWNSKNPDKVKMAYSPDTVWRNRSTFLKGRDEVRDFLEGKWDRERDYRLIKELWAYADDRIAVRFCYEYRNDQGEWFRAHGNENWLFDEQGFMKERHASINDVPIEEKDRKFNWETPDNIRPSSYAELSELGL
jgi:nuclear transport factor 2 (NTF2) superfamily protein